MAKTPKPSWGSSWRGVLSDLTVDLVDAVSDRRCPGCEGPVERDVEVCAACDAAVDRAGSVLCLACLRGDPPEGSGGPDRSTRDSGGRPLGGCPLHGSNRLLLAGPPHAAPLDAILRAFKYAGATRLAPWVASLVPAPPAVPGALGREAVVVPVPLHPSRRAARGFDQAALLASRVGGWWGVPVVGALRRVRETGSQARRGPRERRERVRGAFALEAHEAAVLRGRAVLLLDDVATTGSTLLEAHAALAPAEPAWILALAAAHGGRGGGPQFGPDA